MSEGTNCLINGVAATEVAVTDRGLHYGDGLFETFAVGEGIPELWDRHMRRLRQGCERLDIPLPDMELLRTEAEQLCTGARQAVLKLIITCGSGGRGYRRPQHPQPTRIVSLHPWPDHPRSWRHEGVAVRVCRHRLSVNPALAGIKHLNRLDQVMARGEWNDSTIAEGLMLDPSDRVVEGTMSNLFLVRDGQLITPDLSRVGIGGVMRGLLIDTAADLDIACGLAELTLDDLFDADELLLCNSVIGVWPVRRLEERAYTAPGPITFRLQEAIGEARRQ